MQISVPTMPLKSLILMREWLDDQTDRWDPITSFEQYEVGKISEAEFLGLPPPSFEYKP